MKGETSPEKLLDFWRQGQLSNDEAMQSIFEWLTRQQITMTTLNSNIDQLRAQLTPHQAMLSDLHIVIQHLQTVANRLTTLLDDQATT